VSYSRLDVIQGCGTSHIVDTFFSVAEHVNVQLITVTYTNVIRGLYALSTAFLFDTTPLDATKK